MVSVAFVAPGLGAVRGSCAGEYGHGAPITSGEEEDGQIELKSYHIIGRVLVVEQGLLGIPRSSPREEEARALAQARTRELELAWAAFLERGMEQGMFRKPIRGCSHVRCRDYM